MTSQFDYLLQKHKTVRGNNSADLNLRTYRSIVWLQRADALREADADAAFIFSWISFNAAYARELNESSNEAREEFAEYFEKLIRCDSRNRIDHEVWHLFEGDISDLLNNRYIFSPFWKYQNGDTRYSDWEDRFERAKTAAKYSIQNRETVRTLSIVFDRLYVLRNQLMHGGATWNSSVNRHQIHAATDVLMSLLPLFVDTMLTNPDENWGVPFYPVVD